MKASINLLQSELLPPRQSLTLGRLGWVALLSVGLVLLGYLAAQAPLRQAEERLALARQQQSELDQQLKALLDEKRAQAIDDGLASDIERLREELRIRRQVLAELKKRNALQQGGFAELMEQLAANHDRQLWLTRIALHESDVVLSGKTLNADAVPRWVQGLANVDALAGTRFSTMQMARDDQGVLTFSLQSQLQSANTPVENTPAQGAQKEAK